MSDTQDPLQKTRDQIAADWQAFKENACYADVLAAAKTGTLIEQALFTAFCAGFNAGTRSVADALAHNTSTRSKSKTTTHADLREAGVHNYDEGRMCLLCGGDAPSGFRHEHGLDICTPAKRRAPQPHDEQR